MSRALLWSFNSKLLLYSKLPRNAQSQANGLLQVIFLPNVADKFAKETDAKGLPGSVVAKKFMDYLEAEGFKLPRKFEIK